MKPKEKLFTANPDKTLFTITIVVKENCATISIINGIKSEITYHEIIGALETQKLHLMIIQREQNLKDLKKRNAKIIKDNRIKRTNL